MNVGEIRVFAGKVNDFSFNSPLLLTYLYVDCILCNDRALPKDDGPIPRHILQDIYWPWFAALAAKYKYILPSNYPPFGIFWLHLEMENHQKSR